MISVISSENSPWTDFSWHDWALIGEIGYAPDDFLGLGPGVYRIQPFVGQITGLESVTVTFTSPGAQTRSP